MEATECMLSRRSRRLFLDKEIPAGMLDTVLACGAAAPSSMDCRPWHFVVVKNRELRQKFAAIKEAEVAAICAKNPRLKAILSGKDSTTHIKTAPAVIIVCADTAKSVTRSIEDGVCAAENILLAAHQLGLGAVYVTACNEQKSAASAALKELFNLPEHIAPIAAIPIGYPDHAEKPEPKTPTDLKNITHIDRF